MSRVDNATHIPSNFTEACRYNASLPAMRQTCPAKEQLTETLQPLDDIPFLVITFICLNNTSLTGACSWFADSIDDFLHLLKAMPLFEASRAQLLPFVTNWERLIPLISCLSILTIKYIQMR
jgi:hypothetical protein